MKGNIKIAVLLCLLAAGIAAQQTGLLDADVFLEQFEEVVNLWWFPALTVLIQLVMYMLAFPGSIIMWTLGAIYQPWTATILIMAGGVAGALAAYFFSSYMSSSWTLKFSRSRIFSILVKNSGFLQLCALRCLPGFPHSFINYSSGILKVSLLPFIISTALGFAVKGFIYSSAIYSAIHMDDIDAAVSIYNLWPLLLLVIFSLVGIIVQRKYFPH
jgi:uncharacterized membrane protein YdjX (TVP38/TMEM64 family)